MPNILTGIQCVVPGCKNTFKKVNQWKVRSCEKPEHAGKLHSQCTCPEPYQFFKFPTEIKLQKLWLERVGKTDLEVNNLTRICSLHFADGRPTRRNYFPNPNLNARAVASKPKEDDDTKVTSPTKGTVSIIPIDRLQTQESDDTEPEDSENNSGGQLKISKVTSITPSGHYGNGNYNGMRHKFEDEDSSEYPFEIDVIEDEDDDIDDDNNSSSELSDGIEVIHYSPQKITNSNPPPPPVVRQGVPLIHRLFSGPSNRFLTAKSIATPAPNFKPIITKVATTTPGAKTLHHSVNSNSTPLAPITPKAGQAANVRRNAIKPGVFIVATDGDLSKARTAPPIATFDPVKQQLRISNPVKYIQDCHNRIAELIAEGDKKEERLNQAELKNRQLMARNQELEAKCKQLEEQRNPPPPTNSSNNNDGTGARSQLVTPTFNLIPSLGQGVRLIHATNAGNIVTVSGNGVTNGIIPQIRYVIRRP